MYLQALRHESLSPIQNDLIDFSHCLVMRRYRIVGIVVICTHKILFDIKNMQLVRHNITGEGANWVTIGTTIRFPVEGGKPAAERSGHL